MNGILLTSTAAIEQRLSTYHMLTSLFLVLGGVSLAAAVVQFFGFHIVKIMTVKLGIAAKRTIKEIEDANAEIGSMTASARKGGRVQGKVLRDGRGRMWNTSQLGDGETSPLNDDVAVQVGSFTIIREIMMLHTEERI